MGPVHCESNAFTFTQISTSVRLVSITVAQSFCAKTPRDRSAACLRSTVGPATSRMPWANALVQSQGQTQYSLFVPQQSHHKALYNVRLIWYKSVSLSTCCSLCFACNAANRTNLFIQTVLRRALCFQISTNVLARRAHATGGRCASTPPAPTSARGTL